MRHIELRANYIGIKVDIASIFPDPPPLNGESMEMAQNVKETTKKCQCYVCRLICSAMEQPGETKFPPDYV